MTCILSLRFKVTACGLCWESLLTTSVYKACIMLLRSASARLKDSLFLIFWSLAWWCLLRVWLLFKVNLWGVNGCTGWNQPPLKKKKIILNLITYSLEKVEHIYLSNIFMERILNVCKHMRCWKSNGPQKPHGFQSSEEANSK